MNSDEQRIVRVREAFEQCAYHFGYASLGEMLLDYPGSTCLDEAFEESEATGAVVCWGLWDAHDLAVSLAEVK